MSPQGTVEMLESTLRDWDFVPSATDYVVYIGENLRAIDPAQRPSPDAPEAAIQARDELGDTIEGVRVHVSVDGPGYRVPEASRGTGIHAAWIDVEFAGGRLRHGEVMLNSLGCDEIETFIEHVDQLPDGRWIVNAGASCVRHGHLRGRELVMLLDPERQDARLLWHGHRYREPADFSVHVQHEVHTEARANGETLSIVEVETWELYDRRNERPEWTTYRREEAELRRMTMIPLEPAFEDAPVDAAAMAMERARAAKEHPEPPPSSEDLRPAHH